LARDLIARAENDPSQSIPVVFNLSSWTDPKQDLHEWLVKELRDKYQVPTNKSSQWLKANWLMPLLDGLDEVMPENRPACIRAINSYVQNHGVPGFAVCSRLKEYSDLPVRLGVSGAIRLQPLKPDQVKEYVARVGDALTGLSTALDKDPVFQTLAETPLMLDVMSLAYRDMSAEALVSGALDSERMRRCHLFDTYISKMFIRKGKGTQVYGQEATLGWLGWLARGMQQHGQTVFLIEQLQPSWLTTRGQRVVDIVGSRIVFGLFVGLVVALTGGPPVGLNVKVIFGLILGLILGLVSGLTDEWRFNRGSMWARIEKATPRWQTFIIVAIYGLIYGLIIGLSVGLFAGALYGLLNGLINGPLSGLIYGLIGGLFLGLRNRHRSLTSDIQSVETLRWSRVYARNGCVYGLIYALIVFLSLGLIDVVTGGRLPSLSEGLRAVLLDGLCGGLIGGFFVGLRGSILDIKAIPNLGIKLSMRKCCACGRTRAPGIRSGIRAGFRVDSLAAV
jgi:hypothetical protein